MFESTVQRLDERLARIEWPGMREVSVPFVGANDILLVCAGFEERAAEPLRRICAAQETGFSLGLIKYLPEIEQNRTQELRAISDTAGLHVTEFVYDRERPSRMGETIQQFSQTFERIFVDISGMSRLLVVQTLVALVQSQTKFISIIYGEAREYPPSKDEFNQDNQDDDAFTAPSYLSSGILEIAATPELSSVSMLGEAIRLVTFPSFDPAQLVNLVQELQPTYTDFIHGVPPSQQNMWRTDAIRELNIRTLNELREKHDHQASTLDYRETLEVLFGIYSQRSMFDRFVVAPIGSKMQTVAVGIFRAALHDVQIVYPTPHVFTQPERYTLGVRRLYQLDLPTDAIWSAIKGIEADEDETHRTCE